LSGAIVHDLDLPKGSVILDLRCVYDVANVNMEECQLLAAVIDIPQRGPIIYIISPDLKRSIEVEMMPE
jgi:hypothetical protein